MAKAKTKAQGTSKDRDRELLLTWARQVLADQNATGIDKGRASDVLMRVIGLAVKPADPRPSVKCYAGSPRTTALQGGDALPIPSSLRP